MTRATARARGYHRAVTEPESAGLADSVRLAWPAEAVSISELQRRSWATQWPVALAERMLGSVTTEEMTQAWHRAITRPPGATPGCWSP